MIPWPGKPEQITVGRMPLKGLYYDRLKVRAELQPPYIQGPEMENRVKRLTMKGKVPLLGKVIVADQDYHPTYDNGLTY